MNTMFIYPFGSWFLIVSFGVNLSVSTAFGIVNILYGSIFSLRLTFSLHAVDTAMQASISLKLHLQTLLRLIPAMSLKPNRECSVLTVLSP